MTTLEKKLASMCLIIFFLASTVSMAVRGLYIGSVLTAALVYCFTKVYMDTED